MSVNESYLRWQDIRINQLGFANNLIIGLSVGLIGFSLNFIENQEVLSLAQKSFFWLGCGLELISLLLGILLVWNRLEDFRLTAKIALIRESGNKEGLEVMRTDSTKLGEKTWKYLNFQMIAFFVGFVCITILYILANSEKLF